MNWKPKTRKCKVCKNRFLAARPIEWWCSPECGSALALVKLEKVRQRQRKDLNRKHWLEKKSIKTKGEFLREAQTAFNKFIRERDFFKTCISCRRKNDGTRQIHAGHYLSVGAHPSLRFNEANCHAQCSQCNNFLSGNLVRYRERLVRRIGEDKVLELEGHQPILKLSNDDLLAIKKHYNNEARKLKEQRLKSCN